MAKEKPANCELQANQNLHSQEQEGRPPVVRSWVFKSDTQAKQHQRDVTTHAVTKQ